MKLVDSKILMKIMSDSKVMSQEELINKYKKQDIEIEYYSGVSGFITITNIKDKTNKCDVNLDKMDQYFDDINKLIDNMSNEEFEKLLVEAGIEECPYYEE